MNTRRSLFRPCIDLHEGKVKQIVGSSLRDDGVAPVTNFVSQETPQYYAQMYQRDQVKGGHVIMLGKGNELAAQQALAAFPKGLQIGGGINDQNADFYIKSGASHVIVTSYLFDAQGVFLVDALKRLVDQVGKSQVVIDLSCKRLHDQGWQVMMNRWQTPTELIVNEDSMGILAEYCDEFLIHAVDVEGKSQGMDEDLICFLAKSCPLPCTYAGGIRHLNDLRLFNELSVGRLDATIGTALDIFGGKGVIYQDAVAWNQRKIS
jgi:phosphoribosylformimino-5-aminoimidazole carboxamide ribotide isomerase